MNNNENKLTDDKKLIDGLRLADDRKSADTRNHSDETAISDRLSYREKRRNKAKLQRQKDQLSVTIFGIIIYSIVLIVVVVLAYMGFKSGITKLKERQAIAAAEEERQAKEAEEMERLEKQKAEEEAAAAAALEAEKAEEEEDEDGFEDLVFSVVENVSDPGNAPINLYFFERKSLSDDSGKLMDYEIYTNPENSETVKITTRENCGDLFEITDYYYKDGKVNYISQYREDTDVPIDPSTDKVESRFYFTKDKMVRYIYSENDKAVEYSANDFDLYSEGTVSQYEYMEDMMLENSKTVYENAGSLEKSVVISGYLMDENNCPVKENGKVQLLDKNGRTVQETEPNEDGYYYFIVEPSDSQEYHIGLSGRDDMVPTNVWGIKVPEGTKGIDVETVYLAYSVYDTIYPIQIFVLDGEEANKPLNGAEIRFRYGINTREGETCLTGVLGDAGEIMPALRSGNYTAEISKAGYETCYVSFTVKADSTAIVAHAVKDVAEGGYKCVLGYETTPLDLDLRCFDTYGRNVIKSSVDSVGATSAEVITLQNLDSGTYTFYASDFSEIAGSDMMSYKMSQSSAKMYVYGSEGLEAVFSVPAAHAGVVWRAFEIRNKNVIPINDYYAYIVDNSVFRSK